MAVEFNRDARNVVGFEVGAWRRAYAVRRRGRACPVPPGHRRRPCRGSQFFLCSSFCSLLRPTSVSHGITSSARSPCVRRRLTTVSIPSTHRATLFQVEARPPPLRNFRRSHRPPSGSLTSLSTNSSLQWLTDYGSHETISRAGGLMPPVFKTLSDWLTEQPMSLGPARLS